MFPLEAGAIRSPLIFKFTNSGYITLHHYKAQNHQFRPFSTRRDLTTINKGTFSLGIMVLKAEYLLIPMLKMC